MEINNNTPILSVNLSAISNNWNEYKNIVNNGVCVSAVLKANAYGLGWEKVFNQLYENGCNYFWVATISEALKIRKINKNVDIAVLEGISTDTVKYYTDNNITAVINHESQLQIWQKQENLNTWIHIDTGMNRLGISCKNAGKILNGIKKPYGYMTHLIESEIGNSNKNQQQLDIFNRIVDNLPPAKNLFVIVLAYY